jgi:uncharacterized protein
MCGHAGSTLSGAVVVVFDVDADVDGLIVVALVAGDEVESVAPAWGRAALSPQDATRTAATSSRATRGTAHQCGPAWRSYAVAMFHDGSRSLQDRFDTRRLADRIDELLVHDRIDEHSGAFIEARDMFFLATADAAGRPNCSYKGGEPGFVRVLDPQTIAFPSYDGNGMYLSMGNVLENPEVGLLFIDFEQRSRLRLNGTASVDDADPLLADYPRAQLIVRVRVREVFPNCPRYIHRMQLVERSAFVPRASCEPPVPDWKRSEWAHDALPQDDPARDPTKPSLGA